MKTDTFANQMKWVILLLAAAVILPTVCLLWFMNKAVQNERLAVRQKLIDIYSEKIRIHLTSPLRSACEIELASLKRGNSLKVPWSLNQPLKSSAMIVYDEKGQLIWPLIEGSRLDFMNNPSYARAQSLEYSDHNYPAALQLYKQLVDGNDIEISHRVMMSAARCYLKMGDLENAQKLYQQIAYPVVSDSNDFQYAFKCTPDVMRARVALAELYTDTSNPNLEEHLKRSLEGFVKLEDKQEYRTLLFTPDVWIWGLNRLIRLAELKTPDLRIETARARRRVEEQEYGSLISLVYNDAKVSDLDTGVVTSLETEPALYGIKTQVEGRQVLLVSDTVTIVSGFLWGQWDEIDDESFFVRLIDDQGRCLAGASRPNYQPLTTLAVGDPLPKWKVELYLKNQDIFESLANKQTAVYTWTGMLVVLFILGSGIISVQVVGKQIKLNKLKNDFIATVTHELKTPLSSMRLLVDTLLEKRYDNESTATEYLQMVANENKRLTHLIDSFLTFSRMERNKHVFDFKPVSPAEIANEAAEAMQAKLSSDNCQFIYSITENLSNIKADKDATVTVLVNLLDNAYKYTNENKNIRLEVYEKNGDVCFAVKDNGIGLSPRARKKIFNRFYQADSRLSRRAEGCGLGLSIVKFIVDAHKGNVEVQSRPDNGSLFIVKLPVL